MKQEGHQFSIMIGGLGGQGALLFGRLLVEAGMSRYRNAAYFPNYTGLMRGGPSECTVILSDEEIHSPIVLEPDVAVAMSLAALKDYEKRVKSGGMLLLDSSVIPGRVSRPDLKVFYIPATKVAMEVGDPRVANLVLLGAYLELTKVIPLEFVEQVLEKKLAGGRREALLDLDKKALRHGASLVASSG